MNDFVKSESRDVPILERGDFGAVADKMLADLAMSPKEDAKYCGLRMTSGTSGGNPLLLAWGSGVNIHEFPCGAERMLLCQGALSMRLGSLLFLRIGKSDIASRVIVVDAQDMISGLKKLLADFSPNRLYGFTSFIVKICDFLDAKTRDAVKSLRFTGEGLSKQAEKIMKDFFPQAEIKMLYSSGETGQLSKPTCGFLPPNYYHPHRGVLVEIINMDETGAGDILITKRLSKNVFLARYRIGDIGRFHNINCKCGEKVIFEVIGKQGYDYVKLAGTILRREEFDRVAGICSGLLDDYFVCAESVMSEGKLFGKITLTAYRKSGQCDEQVLIKIKKIFSEELFLTATQTLGELVEKGYIMPLVVEFGGEPPERKSKEVKISQKI